MPAAVDLRAWEPRFEVEAAARCAGADPAHDLQHVKRVVATAKVLAVAEGGTLEIILPAAWLHDMVDIAKSDPRRNQASRLSAAAAADWLRAQSYPTEHLPAIVHAIEAHSFSAGIAATTLEAKIVQDADRLDGIGAIGIARCFATGGAMGRAFYDPADPFAAARPPDDAKGTVDHFYVKLFKTADSLTTGAGRAEGLLRAGVMRRYLEDLKRELGGG